MRITHVVCTDAFAGVEQYVAYVSRQQAENGHTVNVLGGAEAEMRKALGGAGVTWRAASSTGTAARLLRRVRTDIVHVHMTAAEIAAVGTKPWHRRPVVATLHFARSRGSSAVRRLLLREMSRFLDAQIAISAFAAERSAVPCEVILNGVPWNLPTANRQPVVLVAQRLEQEKDTATALRGWAQSALASSGWRLEVAGQGVERGALVALAQELGIDASVEFLGFEPNVKERMTQVGIFLATAPEEPFGLSVVEAMAAGTPVIAADGGAHRETVGSTPDAVLFRPGSAAGCAAGLDALGADAERRDRYGAELQRRWAESFTLAHHCGQLDVVYRRVLGRQAR